MKQSSKATVCVKEYMSDTWIEKQPECETNDWKVTLIFFLMPCKTVELNSVLFEMAPFKGKLTKEKISEKFMLKRY